VLSGFLIAWKYYSALSEINVQYFRIYMIRRAARIYPVYLVLTTLTFIVYMFQAQHLNIDHSVLYLLNITFLKGFFDDLKFSLISQSWSLTVEETFYLTAPFLFLLIRRSKLNLIILPGILVLFGLTLVFLSNGRSFYGFFSDNNFMFTYTFFGRCFEFFIGISLAILFKANSLRERARPWLTYLSIVALSLVLITISNIQISDPGRLIVHQGLIPLLGGLFIAGLLIEGSAIKKILESQVFELFGKSSYSLYLIHLGIIPSFIGIYVSSNPVLLFPLLALISVFLWKQVEEPLRHFILKQVKLKRGV
jgi:peptidoglycan/LPS O-acetylase OafA/YrhL